MANCTGTPRRRTSNKATGSGKNSSQPTRRQPKETPRRRRAPNGGDDNETPTPQGTRLYGSGSFTKFLENRKTFAELMVQLPEDPSSKYAAFLMAGFIGSKEDCDDFCEDDNLQDLIEGIKNSHLVIDESKNGATSKLTEKNVQSLELAVSKGMSYANACHLINIGYNTFWDWMGRGRRDTENENYNTNHAKLFFRINKALPKGELYLLDSIHDAALGRAVAEDKFEHINQAGIETSKRVRVSRRQWQAAAWLLERTRRKHYGRDVKDEDAGQSAEEEANEIVEAVNMLINNQVKNIEEVEKADKG